MYIYIYIYYGYGYLDMCTQTNCKYCNDVAQRPAGWGARVALAGLGPETLASVHS